MANFTFTPSAGLSVTGITPSTGPTSTDKITSSFAGAAVNSDDRHAAVYVVNASTGATAIDLGKIVTGKALWLECDGPLHVTLTQDLGAGPVDAIVRVEKFILLQSNLLGVKVANPNATTAVRMSIVVPGDRIPVGSGAGVF